MKKLLLTSTAFVFTCCNFSNAADAQVSRIYMAGYMGLNIQHDQPFDDNNTGITGDMELDNALSFAGALGLRLSKNIRLEGELSYRKSDVHTLDISTGSFPAGGELKTVLGLVNMYYDFDVPWEVQPFVTAGIGYGLYEGEVTGGASGVSNISEETGAITWQAGAGLKYRTRSNVAFTAGYRYLDALDLDFDGFDLDYDSHEIRVGLEYDLDWR